MISVVLLASLLASCFAWKKDSPRRRASTHDELKQQAELSFYHAKCDDGETVTAGVEDEHAKSNSKTSAVLADQQNVIDAWARIGVANQGRALSHKIHVPKARSSLDDERHALGRSETQHGCVPSCDFIYGVSIFERGDDTPLHLVAYNRKGALVLDIGEISTPDGSAVLMGSSVSLALHTKSGELYLTNDDDLYVVNPCDARAKHLCQLSVAATSMSFSKSGDAFYLGYDSDFYRIDDLEMCTATKLGDGSSSGSIAFDITDQLWFSDRETLVRLDVTRDEIKPTSLPMPTGGSVHAGSLVFDHDNRALAFERVDSRFSSAEAQAYETSVRFYELSTTKPGCRQLELSGARALSLATRRFHCGNDVEPARAVVRQPESPAEFKRKLRIAFWQGCSGEQLTVQAGTEVGVDEFDNDERRQRDWSLLTRLDAKLRDEFMRGVKC